MKSTKNQSVKQSSKNQVVMSKTELSRAKRMSSAYSARRSSKPKKSVADAFEILDPLFETRKAFYLHLKSDLYSPMAEPQYVMIDGVPHKRLNGKYIALTPKASNNNMTRSELFMYKELLKLAGMTFQK